MFFPIFLKILIFWVYRWVKGQKMVQNDKKLCLLHSISQEPYIWFSFMVQMCKMIISSGVFFTVKILIFQAVKGLKGQKMAQKVENFFLSHLVFQELYIIWSSFMVDMYVKWQKILCLTPYPSNRTSYDCGFWCTCVKWWYFQHIFGGF